MIGDHLKLGENVPEEAAVHAATLAQVTASLSALRKVAHDSEILMEREAKV